MLKKIFPSKILLFGEYTVILNSKAIAIPYHNYSSQWCELPSNVSSTVAQQSDLSKKALQLMANHIGQQQAKGLLLDCNLEALVCAQEENIFFESNILKGFFISLLIDSFAIC